MAQTVQPIDPYLPKKPADIIALHKLTQSFEERVEANDLPAAELLASRAHSQFPCSTSDTLLMFILVRRGRLADAAIVGMGAFSAGREDPLIACQMVMCLSVLKRFEEANAWLEKAGELDAPKGLFLLSASYLAAMSRQFQAAHKLAMGASELGEWPEGQDLGAWFAESLQPVLDSLREQVANA